MGWMELRTLWSQVCKGETPGWERGRAFEYLIVRAFELSGLRVEYPFDVPPGGRPIEQIDGVVFLDQIPLLIECKDRGVVDIVAVAKMRNQLLRRPPITLGSVFVTGDFTSQALILADYATPHQILLWSSEEIATAIAAGDFRTTLTRKYHDLCMFGMTDHSPNFQALEVRSE